MSKREKLVQRFIAMPRHFTWQELVSLLAGFGCELSPAGSTSGSRVRFVHEQLPPIILHEPHPTPVLKRYQMEQIMETLHKEGLL